MTGKAVSSRATIQYQRPRPTKMGLRSCAKLADASFHKFYFIKPVPGNDADSLASMLLLLEGVEEVHITEGEYGLIVKAKAASMASASTDKIGNYIADTLNEKFNAAVSYYRYRK